MLLNCGVGEDSWEFWPPDAKSWLFGRHPGAGKDWGQKEKGTTEDEMFRWHHQLDGHEFEQALGVGDGQGNLECCSPWSHRLEWLNSTEWLSWVMRLRAHVLFGFLSGGNIWVHKQKVFYFQSFHCLLPSPDFACGSHRASLVQFFLCCVLCALFSALCSIRIK